jgi:septal ring factor EnvC (AmiA/AmiB activator)
MMDIRKLFLRGYWSLFLIFASTALNLVEAEDNSKVSKQIKQLSNSLETKKAQFKQLRTEVEKVEKQLGTIAQQKKKTQQDIRGSKRKLNQLRTEKHQLNSELEQQREALAQQLQALYSAGEQSHLRLLLRQDEPSEISRTMKYFEYFNNARVLKIQLAQTTLTKLKQLEQTMHAEQKKGVALIAQLSTESKQVQQLLLLRSKGLDKLNSTIFSKEQRLAHLLAEEAQLRAIVEKVSKNVIEPEPVTINQISKNKKNVKESGNETKFDNGKKHVASSASMPKGKKVTTHKIPNKAMRLLKGKLSWPIEGVMIHRYGHKKNDLEKWKGVVLAAKAGTKVRAIAKGQVVLSDWFGDFGQMVIIQHDKDYLSLYGYNSLLNKKEGDWVQAGDIIAEVGNSGGRDRDALYFKIVKGSKPQNPNPWFKP